MENLAQLGAGIAIGFGATGVICVGTEEPMYGDTDNDV